MQAVGTQQRPSPTSVFPAIALILLATLVAVGMTLVGPLALVPVFGLLFFALVVGRPHYGIALFISTFLLTYPSWLQGAGSLTPNNLLGAVFIVLLSYKMYREPDWWWARLIELRLLLFIYIAFYLADRFNGPDPRTLAMVGSLLVTRAESPRTFLTRSIFTLLFVNYIRTQGHVVMIYILAIAFMTFTALTGIHSVLHGTALHGFRASSAVMLQAGNPNRLAMFSIMPIAAAWYAMRWFRSAVLRCALLPLIAVLALAVFMTGSRSGLLGLSVCGMMILMRERLRLTQWLAVGLAGILVLILVIELVPEKTYDRITNLPFTHGGETGEGSGSLQRRAYGWKVAFEMFKRHPFIGVGIGNYELVRYLTDPTHDTTPPHSSYILAAVEGGLVCLTGFLLLQWQTWKNLRFAERHLRDPTSPLAGVRWIVSSAEVNLVVLAFFSLVADLWQYVILFWLVGLGVVLRRMVEQSLTHELAGT